MSVSDGPCGLYVDASVDASTDAGVCPYGAACPCAPADDAGPPPCIEYAIGVCVGGVWQRSDHVRNTTCS